MKILNWNFLWAGEGGSWGKFYKKVNAEQKKIHSYVQVEEQSLSTRRFLKVGLISRACTVESLMSGAHMTGDVTHQ